MFLSHLIVFACSFVADALYGAYTISLTRGKVACAVAAAAISSGLGKMLLASSLHDWWHLPAAALGETLGTGCVLFLTFRHRPKKPTSQPADPWNPPNG